MTIFGSGGRRRVAALLYAEAVAAARAPALYRDFRVADTIEGRYELIVLHVVLLARRLSSPDDAKLAQALVDFMAADLDRSIRELGVGDLSVGKFMKRLGEGLYGRAQAYNAALAVPPPALEQAILRNIHAGIDPGPGGGLLALMTDYVHNQDKHLAGQEIANIRAGSVDFLTPPDLES